MLLESNVFYTLIFMLANGCQNVNFSSNEVTQIDPMDGWKWWIPNKLMQESYLTCPVGMDVRL